jgi:hypothetical protein
LASRRPEKAKRVLRCRKHNATSFAEIFYTGRDTRLYGRQDAHRHTERGLTRPLFCQFRGGEKMSAAMIYLSRLGESIAPFSPAIHLII